jgi:methyl-accepting chemotaxis protein
VTSEVAENIAKVFSGVQQANRGVSQIVATAQVMAQDIVAVNKAIDHIRSSGQHVQTSSTALSHLAQQLKGLVGSQS